ncbi:Pal1-domain-containing protein [Xylariaceae sp. FL0804]|nr:Pal1-domain-containing protein [Xylariaceae sp. FL0804]
MHCKQLLSPLPQGAIIVTTGRCCCCHKKQSPLILPPLQDNLIIDDTGPRKPQPPTELKARPDQGRPFMSRTTTGGGPGRGENQPPRGGCAPPLGSHRLSRSQEEAQKARRMQAGMNGDKPLPGSPQRRTERRPRRNSESSVMDKPQTEEEKRRQRDRDRRHRDGKPRPRKIDIIDQLDATSIYGTGLFHHDGPFDACNPHRNRKGSRRAPMQAFAKDSANNSLGGSGPINKRPDHMQFMGTETHEATTMYGGEGLKKDRSNRAEIALWDPKQREVFEHGEESQGLGTSTFLEGAPAAATDIARHQAETAQEAVEGIGRKKSVVQRFRSIKRAPREPRQYGDRVTSPDAYYSPTSAMQTGASASERNPFFNEFDKGGEQITVKRKDSNVMSPMSPPGPSLERRSTADATLESEATPKQGGGFMSRVKSLKGGRRQPPAPPAKEYAPAPAPGAAV